MAKSEATLILRIKAFGTKQIEKVTEKFNTLSDKLKESKIGKFSESISKVGRAAFGVIAPIGAMIVAVGAVVVGLGKLAIGASVAKEVQTAFTNLVKSQGQDSKLLLKTLKEASQGTVSELELMKNANQAALLGIPLERFGDMIKIARGAAKATGQSMDFLLNSIVVGIGRSSKLIIDNLGILVDVTKANKIYARVLGKTASKLTDAEKKTAFMNATLKAGLKNSKALGAGTLSLREMWDKLKATMENWVVAAGTSLIPMFKLIISTANKVTSAIESVFEGPSIEDQKAKLETLNKAYNRWFAVLQKAPGHFAAINRVRALKEEIDAIQKVVDADSKRIENIKKTKETLIEKEKSQAEHNAKMAALDIETKEAQKERDQEDRTIEKEIQSTQDEEDTERLKAKFDLKNDVQRDALLKSITNEIKHENDRSKKLDLIDQKRLIQKIKFNNSASKADEKRVARQAQLDKQRESDQRSTFSTIATLSNSNNKALATIGKAAGITQIAIDTPVAIGRALSAFPPPFNFIAAALVGTAMAAQAANIAGVPLADGGIVRSTPGGIQATIGEGGQDEAVIPLDDDGGAAGGLGSTIINFNGPILGDPSQAREFAIKLDEELLSLRKDGESVSFEEDFT